MKRRPDDDRIFLPKKPRVETLEGFAPLSEPAPSVPTIRTPAPSAPGSETSRDAASLVSIDAECLRCLAWYAKQPRPSTRYELAHAVYPVDLAKKRDTVGVGPACGRTNTLVTLGYLEEVGKIGKRATLCVTEAVLRWLAKRQAA